jgi:hypothetical protein
MLILATTPKGILTMKSTRKVHGENSLVRHTESPSLRGPSTPRLPRCAGQSLRSG